MKARAALDKNMWIRYNIIWMVEGHEYPTACHNIPKSFHHSINLSAFVKLFVTVDGGLLNCAVG